MQWFGNIPKNNLETEKHTYYFCRFQSKQLYHKTPSTPCDMFNVNIPNILDIFDML